MSHKLQCVGGPDDGMDFEFSSDLNSGDLPTEISLPSRLLDGEHGKVWRSAIYHRCGSHYKFSGKYREMPAEEAKENEK